MGKVESVSNNEKWRALFLGQTWITGTLNIFQICRLFQFKISLMKKVGNKS